MNTNDKKLVIQFLEDLSDKLGNEGCNDYFLPNTPENFDLVTRVAHWVFDDSPDDLESRLPKPGDEKLLTMDWFVVDYLALQLKKELE